MHQPSCLASVLLAAATLAAPASAQASFEEAVLAQLVCETPPSPVPILAALADAGLIDPAANLGYDSLSCFLIEGGVDIGGLRVNSVCAFEEDGALRAQRPDLFYRGPGTSPGQVLSFGTSANQGAVARWYAATIGTRHLSEAISEGSAIGDKTSVECSSWFSG